jgi:hypothetical protein
MSEWTYTIYIGGSIVACGVSQTEVWCFAQAIMEKYHADAYLKITVEREQR